MGCAGSKPKPNPKNPNTTDPKKPISTEPMNPEKVPAQQSKKPENVQAANPEQSIEDVVREEDSPNFDTNFHRLDLHVAVEQ